jgi:hypothetical protein
VIVARKSVRSLDVDVPHQVLPNRSNYSHWRAASKAAKQLRSETHMLAHGLPRVETPARLEVVRRYAGRKRSMDRDNIAAGAKPMIDGLVDAGVLPGDTEEHLVLVYARQERVPLDMAGTLLRLRTIEAGSCPMCGTTEQFFQD